jgi:hypothetical protein
MSGTGTLRFQDIPRPESEAATAALEIAAAYYSPSLLNHCLRSYLWAASYGLMSHVSFDTELLYVASVFHDIGLATEFDNHTLPFEEAGGHVARVFAAGAGWPATRGVRAAEIIAAHMRGDVDAGDDPEGYLLAVATRFDISGARADAWPPSLQAEVVTFLPRLEIAGEFLRCFHDQAARKPESAAAASLRSGLAGRLDANPLDRLPG